MSATRLCGATIPALLTNAVNVPSSAAASKAPRMSPSLVTSARMARARTPVIGTLFGDLFGRGLLLAVGEAYGVPAFGEDDRCGGANAPPSTFDQNDVEHAGELVTRRKGDLPPYVD